MYPSLLRLALITIGIGTSFLTVFAQDRGYHMELSDGTSGWVILVNDSQKPIEAFSFRGTCASGGAIDTGTYFTSEDYTDTGLGTGYTGASYTGASFMYDALDSGGELRSHTQVDGRQINQRSLIQPGERFFALEKLLPQPSGCTWEGHIDGVIYADGTYQGDKSTIRELQARRAGIAAALQYWTKLHEDGPEVSDEKITYAKAEQISRKDFTKQMFPGCRSQPVACAYWSGRHQVDSNVALQVRQKQPLLVSAFVERWEKKVDADDAFKKMSTTFLLPVKAEAQSALSPSRH
jgi:hypothetical protein